MKYSIGAEQLNQLTEILEDSVEYFCDENMVSGELTWIIVQTLAQAKLNELNGQLTA